MLDVRALLAELEGETDSMLAATARLAAIDSGSHDAAGVDRVGDALAEMLAPLGFRVRRERGREHGARLAATLRLGAGPRLLIVGHADTVWPAGTAARWPVQRDEGMLSGPGVGDMKGCVVMAIHAVAATLRRGGERGAALAGIGEIALLIVPDEELGSPHSRAWIERFARGAGACLGLEAGLPGGGVIVARGAVGALRVRARGRTAHCAEADHEGASAVAALAPLVGSLEALSRPGDGVTVNVGAFRGGIARQVVPDEAELLVDLRAPDMQTARRLLERVRALVRDASGDGVAVTLEGGVTRPALDPAVSQGLWEIASRRARELGIRLLPGRTRGGADASFAAALGVPTLDGLGPICHDSCARGERIEIDSLAQRAALLAALVLDLAAAWRQAAARTRPAPAGT